MQHLNYPGIPTVWKFREDSSVTFAVRNEDKILIHLDWLLERYERYLRKEPDASLQHIVLCDLFQASNYWIKSYHQQRPGFLKGRYPAVLALFQATADRLAKSLGCARAYVGKALEEVFGRDLTPEGAKVDQRMDPAMFTKQQRALFRIRFKNGIAYHYGLDADPDSLVLSPLQTEHFFTAVGRKGHGGARADAFPGWAPFVMTLEREFFMTKHWLNEAGKKNVFHSAYTHGGTIAAAGTMQAKDGIIIGLRPDSGHYKPLEHNFVGALLALHMFGANPDKIEVFGWQGESLGQARDFVADRLKWSKYLDARLDFVQKRKTASAPQAAPRPAIAIGRQGASGVLAPGYTQTPPSGG